MEIHYLSFYVSLGVHLRWAIRCAEENWDVHGDGGFLRAVKRMLESLEPLAFPVTQQVATRLVELTAPLVNSAKTRELTREEADAFTTELMLIE